MEDFEIVWDGRGPLTASLERDYVVLDPDEIVYWPPPLIFDWERFAQFRITIVTTRQWQRWRGKIGWQDRRCGHCRRWFEPKRRTTECCSERCQQARYRRGRRSARGLRVRHLRVAGSCASGHLLKFVGTAKGECRECKRERDRARRRMSA